MAFFDLFKNIFSDKKVCNDINKKIAVPYIDQTDGYEAQIKRLLKSKPWNKYNDGVLDALYYAVYCEGKNYNYDYRKLLSFYANVKGLEELDFIKETIEDECKEINSKLLGASSSNDRRILIEKRRFVIRKYLISFYSNKIDEGINEILKEINIEKLDENNLEESKLNSKVIEMVRFAPLMEQRKQISEYKNIENINRLQNYATIRACIRPNCSNILDKIKIDYLVKDYDKILQTVFYVGFEVDRYEGRHREKEEQERNIIEFEKFNLLKYIFSDDRCPDNILVQREIVDFFKMDMEKNVPKEKVLSYLKGKLSNYE